MNKELIIRSNSSAVDFALLKDGKLIELNKEVEDNKFSVGDIFYAKVRKSVSGLNAAFVNVGHEKDGFLHYHDLGPKLPSLLKFIKQLSTGKTKDYLLKNFKFEAEIEKTGKLVTSLTRISTFLFRWSKSPFRLRVRALVQNYRLQDAIWCLSPFLTVSRFLKKLKIAKKKTD